MRARIGLRWETMSSCWWLLCDDWAIYCSSATTVKARKHVRPKYIPPHGRSSRSGWSGFGRTTFCLKKNKHGQSLSMRLRAMFEQLGDSNAQRLRRFELNAPRVRYKCTSCTAQYWRIDMYICVQCTVKPVMATTWIRGPPGQGDQISLARTVLHSKYPV